VQLNITEDLDDLAAINGTINYEITCCFDLRIPKVYLNYPKGMLEMAD
jgi:alanine racemase